MTTCPKHDCPLTQNRSSPDHRRFFGVIRAAFAHWPEGHDFDPDDETHLRKWLLCKAGFRTVTPIEADYADDQPAMLQLVALTVEQALRAANGGGFVRIHGNAIVVFAAKSIAFDKIKRAEWNDIRDKVEAVIEQELNMPADQLLKEHERAA